MGNSCSPVRLAVLVMSLMVSFCAVLFPTRCLGWNLGLNWLIFCGFSYLLLHIRAVVFVPCGDLKNLPVHSFNVFIIPILRDCLPNFFSSPELKARGGAYGMGSLRRPSSAHTFRWFLHWNHWTKCNKILYVASRHWGNKNSLNGVNPKFQMAAMPIYGKTHSNIFFSRTIRPIRLMFCRKHMGNLPI